MNQLQYQSVLGKKEINRYRDEIFRFYTKHYLNFKILGQKIKTDTFLQVNLLIDNFLAVFFVREPVKGDIIGILGYRQFTEYNKYHTSKETIPCAHPSIQLIESREIQKKYHKLRENLNILAINHIQNKGIEIEKIIRCGPLFINKEYRNLGLARKLFHLLFKEALSQGYKYILEQPASFLCQKILVQKKIPQIGKVEVNFSSHSFSERSEVLSNFFLNMEEYLTCRDGCDLFHEEE